MIKFAESLGGVETLITYPVTQTHADVPPEIRERNGITDSTLRLSVGIESSKDLLGELEQVFREIEESHIECSNNLYIGFKRKEERNGKEDSYIIYGSSNACIAYSVWKQTGQHG